MIHATCKCGTGKGLRRSGYAPLAKAGDAGTSFRFRSFADGAGPQFSISLLFGCGSSALRRMGRKNG